MLRIILVYGILAGAIVIGAMTIGLAMSGNNIDSASGSQLFGYLIMILALSLIFMGVKRYRDKEKGGIIKFFPAFGVGVGIAAVAGVIYVIGWEIYLASTDHAFISQYTAGIIEKKRADGLAGPELNALIQKMKAMETNYMNPLYRLPITFSEIFPVGLLVALISAALLRNPKVFPAK